MIMESARYFTQESGPDEDHQTFLQKQKVIEDVEYQAVPWKCGVYGIYRTDPLIEKFLEDVPCLIEQEGTYGYIWDKKLQPSDGEYELGEHYLSTREADIKSAHGVVSFYRDGVTGVKFAIKTLEVNAHFHPEEIKIGLTNEHPNICSVYGIIIRDHRIYMLFEYAGSPLHKERGWIAECPERMLLAAKQCFQALEVLHKRGYVHCDIKPGNIMVLREDNGFTMKLIDFGSCQPIGTYLSKHAHTTLLYWSPEIWQDSMSKNEIKCRTGMDIYAMALTLYFLQEGHHLMQKLCDKDIKNLMLTTPDSLLLIALPETIPTELRAVIKPCLSGNKEKRLTAQEAVAQLTAEHTLMQQPVPSLEPENYTDSFRRILNAPFGPSDPRTSASNHFSIQPETSFAFAPKPQEKVQYFVGSSKRAPVEKREFCPTPTRSRKGVSFIGSKCSKPQSKAKKNVKLPAKPIHHASFLDLRKKNTLERLNTSKMGSPSADEKAVSPAPGLEKMVVPKTDEKIYSCSSLLKQLALQFQPKTSTPQGEQQKCFSIQEGTSDVNDTISPLKGCGSSVTSKNQLIKIDEKKINRILKQPPIEEVGLSGDKQVHDEEAKKLMSGTSGQNSKPREKVTLKAFNPRRAVQPAPETTDIVINPSAGEALTQKNEAGHSLKTNPGGVEDDMDFVFDVLDTSTLTGKEDDIVDSWLKMLDSDEGTGTHNANRPENVMEVNSGKINSKKSSSGSPHTVDHEPMDIEEKGGNSTKKDLGKVENPLSKESRKRIAEQVPNPSNIPEKAIWQHTRMTNHDESEQQLPNFDQILPEQQF